MDARPASHIKPLLERASFALIVYSLFSLVQLFPLTLNFASSWLGGADWNQFLGQAQAELTSLLRYGEFPLWNPWRHGGQVSFAQPESMFLSPVTPLAALIGVVPAFKLLAFPLFVIGCLGWHAFAQDIGLSGTSRFVPAFTFFGSAVFPLYVAGGLPSWLHALAVMPWLVRSVWLAGERDTHRHVLIAGALHAFLLWCGSIHHFVFVPVLMVLVVFARALELKSLRPVGALALTFAVSIGFAAPRLLPVFDVYQHFPREVSPEGRFVTATLLLASFLEPVVPWRIDLSSLASTWIHLAPGQSVQWVNAGSFMGPVAVMFALIGVASAGRRGIAFLLVAAVFAWASFGSAYEPSLWIWLCKLPVFSSMRAPERLVVYVTFAVAMFAGFGAACIDRLIASNSQTVRRTIFGTACVLLLAPMLWFNGPIAATAFCVPAPDIAPAGRFFQGPPRQDARQWGGELYVSVLENRGNPIAESDIPMPVLVKSSDEPSYRGEVYLLSGQPIEAVTISPNSVHVEANLSGVDTLVINQNYFPGHRIEGVAGASVYEREGLIAVDLPPGRHDVRLRFAQPAVWRGLFLGGIAIALFVVAWFTRSTRTRRFVLMAQIGVAIATVVALYFVAANRHENQWRPPTRRSWFVDGAGSTVGSFPTIQSVIDIANVDDVIRVKGGDYAGFVLNKGVTIARDGDAPVVIRGRAAVENLPRGSAARIVGLEFASADIHGTESLAIERNDATVTLQSVTVRGPPAPGGASAVRIHHCTRIHILGGEMRSANVAIDIEDSMITIARLRTVATPLVLRAVRSDVIAADLDADPTQIVAEASSIIRRGHDKIADSAQSPMVRVVSSSFAIPYLEVECSGSPGARGFLLVGSESASEADENAAGEIKRLVQLTDHRYPMIPLVMPAEGSIRFVIAQPGGDLGIGSACYVQLALETAPGSLRFECSPLDGLLRTGP